MSIAATTPGCSDLRLGGRKLLLPKIKGGKGRNGVPPIPGVLEEEVQHPPRTQSMEAGLYPSPCPDDPPPWPR